MEQKDAKTYDRLSGKSLVIAGIGVGVESWQEARLVVDELLLPNSLSLDAFAGNETDCTSTSMAIMLGIIG